VLSSLYQLLHYVLVAVQRILCAASLLQQHHG
jgi:hypothetical protein